MANVITFLATTNINHSSRKKLNLSLNEYCVADTIYIASNSPEGKEVGGWCCISKEGIGDLLDLNKRTISMIINKLIISGVVEKFEEGECHLRTTDKWYQAINF